MKKAKVLLSTIAVFAVVGTALAFNAKYTTKFCTASLNAGQCPSSCPNPYTGRVGTSGTTVCYQQTTGTCDGSTQCTTSDILVTD